MKHLIILALFLTSFVVKSQNENFYEEVISKTLTKLDSARTDKNLKKINNELKRISKVYPNEILTDYYIGLTDLHLFLIDQKSNSAYLKDAENIAKKLNETKSEKLSKSELLTLEGYIYMIKISSNPMEFAMSLSPKVGGLFAQAMIIDQSNPRPKILNELFIIGKKKFFKEDISDNCKTIPLIEPLLENQEKSLYKPTWGKGELENFKKSCSL